MKNLTVALNVIMEEGTDRQAGELISLLYLFIFFGK
jgi:hypothetical protein